MANWRAVGAKGVGQHRGIELTTFVNSVSNLNLRCDVGIVQRPARFMFQRVRESWMADVTPIRPERSRSTRPTMAAGSETFTPSAAAKLAEGTARLSWSAPASATGNSIRAGQVHRQGDLASFVAAIVRPGLTDYIDSRCSC